jgi:hypothetical protein
MGTDRRVVHKTEAVERRKKAGGEDKDKKRACVVPS